MEEGGGMLDKIIAALIIIESGGSTDAVNYDTMAVGPLQIRAIMVRDVNHLLGRRVYEHGDAYDTKMATEMAKVYFAHRVTKKGLGRAPEADDYALAWRWGPRGPKLARNEAMKEYLERFHAALASQGEREKAEKKEPQKTKRRQGSPFDFDPVVTGGTKPGGK